MTYWDGYLQPTTVDEALRDLAEAPGESRVIAGGTDLLLDLQQGRQVPVRALVDVTGIPELRDICEADGSVFIGAAATHSRIVEHPLLIRHAPCLVEACSLIGGPQVRNVATLGGNVAHGLPAADGTIALLALGAQAVVAEAGGRRTVPLESLFLAPGRTTLSGRAAILVGFRFPQREAREGCAFQRTMRPQGIAIAILNMALWLRLDATGIVAEARLAVGPGGPTPRRALMAEARLCGQLSKGVGIERVLEALADDVQLRTSAHRATAEYRHHMLGVLLRRIVPRALASVGGELPAIDHEPGESVEAG
ncbi:MAG TPA: xanthine dehydrogenase family protein subunit M [Anaerolineales bacterium]|nr:xanthine dehydrogenase family protein subunit M [Anaerolineales bacterium]